MHRIKRPLALSLFFLLLFSVAFSAPVSVTAEDGARECHCDNTPIVYVYGRQATYDHPYGEERRILLPDRMSPELDAIVQDAVPYYFKAVTLGQWDAFCDFLAERGSAMYEGFAPDKEGNVVDGSGVDWSWSEEWLMQNDFHNDPGFVVYGYVYDARLDPFEIAVDLNNYIETIKKATGHSKVNLIARCQGAVFAFAYLAEYGWNSLETYVQYCTAANGTTLFSEMMAGKIKFNADALERYSDQAVLLREQELDYIAKQLIHYMNRYYDLDVTLFNVQLTYNMIYERILPRIFRNSYGTAPGYWGMVGSKDYEDAKKLIFGGHEDEYAVLIEKLDNYDRRVRTKTYDILKQMHEDGVKLGNVVKSGMQMEPFTESHDMISDDKITIYDQSFGVYSAPYGTELDSAYLRKAVAERRSQYISPDLTIDASTCLFPDTTWFIDKLSHYTFSGCENDLLCAICRSKDEMTVWDNADYPQFLSVDWSINHTVPMQAPEEPEPLTFREKLQAWWSSTFIPTILRIFKHLRYYLDAKKEQQA